MKKRLLTACMAFLLVGCTAQTSVNTTPTETPEVETEKNIAEEYTSLNTENQFYYGEQEAVINMLEHGSGIVYFGFPECPFCQYYTPILDTVAKENDVQVMYYNILDDRTNNTEFYQTVVSILGDNLDYDSDGNPRIYVPQVTFVVKGEIIGYDNESSMVDSSEMSPEEYWDEDKLEALNTKLSDLTAQVASARQQTDNAGCDTSCSY